VAHFFPAAPLRRDFERFDMARSEADWLPLDRAIAGTAYSIDVNAPARHLGFVVVNSIDASSDRDFAATFLYACATTMVHLSRLAEDLIILSGDEHHFFELSDALSTGSSMMPQKKNPDPLELVRGKQGGQWRLSHLDDTEGCRAAQNTSRRTSTPCSMQKKWSPAARRSSSP
jgi:argininosuccinate lyase